MRLIDGDKLRARACEIFLCAEPGSAEEKRFALVLGLIDSEPTIAPPHNDHLTMEELREMDGEPVWVELININRPNKWYLLNLRENVVVNNRGGFVSLIHYGDTWLAYRRKPDEVET